LCAATRDGVFAALKIHGRQVYIFFGHLTLIFWAFGSLYHNGGEIEK